MVLFYSVLLAEVFVVFVFHVSSAVLAVQCSVLMMPCQVVLILVLLQFASVPMSDVALSENLYSV